jgi:hypothetical protein
MTDAELDRWHACAPLLPDGGCEAVRTLVAELREERHLLFNLLAVIHRDGGDYTEKHGLVKSAADAETVVIKTRGQLHDLREALENALHP